MLKRVGVLGFSPEYRAGRIACVALSGCYSYTIGVSSGGRVLIIAYSHGGSVGKHRTRETGAAC